MRSATALLATLIPLAGVGGWLAGHTAGERWRAPATVSGAEEEPGSDRVRPQIDLVVEYEPPVDGRVVAPRALPPPTRHAAPELEPEPVEADPTVMQRLLTLYERIGQAP
jgi:hypothetical protein